MSTAAVIGRFGFFFFALLASAIFIAVYGHMDCYTYLSMCACIVFSLYCLLVWRSEVGKSRTLQAFEDYLDTAAGKRAALVTGRAGFFLFASVAFALTIGKFGHHTIYSYLTVWALILLSLYGLLVWRSEADAARHGD